MTSEQALRNIRAALSAITQIPRRAERQTHTALSETFVDIGPLFGSLKRADHQVIYGRRGTGKTHALGNLHTWLEGKSIAVADVDMRTIGSAGGLYGDPREPLADRATPLLVDLAEAVHSRLVDYTLELISNEHEVTGLVGALDSLAAAITDVEVIGTVEQEDSHESTDSSSSSLGIKASLSKFDIGIEGDSKRSKASVHSSKSRVAGEVRYTVKFGPLSNAMRNVARHTPAKQVWILLDEWSAIPMELQPILADFLRRALLPVPGVVVKIAAVERRSLFNVPGSGDDYLGIELGSDISQDVTLDDYLIFDSESDRAGLFFEDLLARHIRAIEPGVSDYFPPTDYGRRKLTWAIWKDGAFDEFVRAAEGIPRDGINIAGLAAQRATQEWGQEGISTDDVRQAARAWFLRDKAGSIKAHRFATRALGHITNFAVNRRKRTFLIERGHDSNHDIIQVLYDKRLIHLLRSGVGPGGNFDLFALDYGAYSDLLASSEEFKSWEDSWTTGWNDLDPSRSPLVRQGILSVAELRELPRSSEN